MSMQDEVRRVHEIIKPMMPEHTVYFSCTFYINSNSDSVDVAWEASSYNPKMQCKAPNLVDCANKFMRMYYEAIQLPETETVQLLALPSPVEVEGEVLNG